MPPHGGVGAVTCPLIIEDQLTPANISKLLNGSIAGVVSRGFIDTDACQL